MAATALIQFVQGATVGTPGQAVAGVAGALVSIANDDPTDILSWRIDLVYVPPASGLAVGTLATGNGNVPAASFTPDVPGSYRVILYVYTQIGQTGTVDVDIRNFAVPDVLGIVYPPYQELPAKLPILGSGSDREKPDELNFNNQAFGWSGNGADGLVHQFIVLTSSRLAGVWQEPVLDKDLTAPPGGPSTGDRYLVGTGGSGAWSGQDDDIATWSGTEWQFLTPSVGATVYVIDEATWYRFSSGSWAILAGGGGAVASVFGRSGVVVAVAGDYTALEVDYDNTGSGLAAVTVQAAVDELAAGSSPVDSVFGRVGAVVAVAGDYSSQQVSYDNAVSGLAATDVKNAVDELAAAAPNTHAASHEGGSDTLDVTALGGYPGGGTTFLRDDGTFAPPTANDAAAVHDNVAGEIAAITAKSPLVGADTILVEDSAAADSKKSATIADIRITESQVTDLDHTDVNAFHSNVSGEIAALTAVTLSGSDHVLIEDVDDANAKKRVLASEFFGTGTDADAIHDNVSNEFGGVAQETTPADTDRLLIESAANAFAKRYIEVASLLPQPAPATWADYAWDGDDLNIDNPTNTIINWPDLDTTSPFIVTVGFVGVSPSEFNGTVGQVFAYPASGGDFGIPKYSAVMASDVLSATLAAAIPAASDLYLAIHSRIFSSVNGAIVSTNGGLCVGVTTADTLNIQWQRAGGGYAQMTLAIANIPGLNGGPGLLEFIYDSDTSFLVYYKGELILGRLDAPQNLGAFNAAHTTIAICDDIVAAPAISGNARINIDGVVLSGTLPTVAQRRSLYAYYK